MMMEAKRNEKRVEKGRESVNRRFSHGEHAHSLGKTSNEKQTKHFWNSRTQKEEQEAEERKRKRTVTETQSCDSSFFLAALSSLLVLTANGDRFLTFSLQRQIQSSRRGRRRRAIFK
jgi:hypothetical protein